MQKKKLGQNVAAGQEKVWNRTAAVSTLNETNENKHIDVVYWSNPEVSNTHYSGVWHMP